MDRRVIIKVRAFIRAAFRGFLPLFHLGNIMETPLKIALLIEASRGFGRGTLAGIADYAVNTDRGCSCTTNGLHPTLRPSNLGIGGPKELW